MANPTPKKITAYTKKSFSLTMERNNKIFMVKKHTKPSLKVIHQSNPRVLAANKLIATPVFDYVYMAVAVLVALGTSLFWSLSSARLKQGNADQLVDTYLFKNSATLHGAVFPGDHTMLLKWPIFWLTKLFGSTPAAITAFTVILVLFTVICLLLFIYKIERRPLVFGTLCLALASVLLMVPPQSYAGALLPVNMAMLTTRNIEYVFYIASLALILKSLKIKSWGFWLGVLILSLLIASDKLFLVISIGGAALAMVVYAVFKAWRWVSMFVNWLIVGAICSVIAMVIIWLIGASHLTHIGSGATIAPYTVSSGAKGFVLGGLYAVMGIFTNFGANPAFNSTIARNIPHQFISQLFSWPDRLI